MKYILTISQMARFATVQEAAKALSETARPGFEVQHAFIDLTDNNVTADAPTPEAAPAPAPKPAAKPKAEKPAADQAPAPASDAEPAPSPAPAPAPAPASKAVTVADVRAYLIPFTKVDEGARKAEVNTFIKTYGVNLDSVPANKLAAMLEAAKEQFQ